VGPATGRAAAPRARLAGPPDLQRCDELREQGHEALLRERTGLVVDPYFSATKIEWLLREVDGLADRAAAGRAVFGTIDAWLIFKLTGELATDATNASRTLLCDIRSCAWDPELLELFGVPERSLPEIRPSIGEFGRTRDGRCPASTTCPVSGIAGDQQAALYGQACLDPGQGKNTYGTGSFVLLNAGDAMPPPREGLLTTVAWQIGERTFYALEAAVFVTGAAVQWLRDGLGIIKEAGETEGLARSVKSTDGVVFVPALTGLGSPHWDPYARGTIVGLTRGARARTSCARRSRRSPSRPSTRCARWTRRPTSRCASCAPTAARASTGGSCSSRPTCLGVPVVLPQVPETTALGAAFLAASAPACSARDRCASSTATGALRAADVRRRTRVAPCGVGARRRTCAWLGFGVASRARWPTISSR
jgi:glycerol kinase